MNVPYIIRLTNHTFSSEFIEFVWNFDGKEVIAQFRKDGTSYIEDEGNVKDRYFKENELVTLGSDVVKYLSNL